MALSYVTNRTTFPTNSSTHSTVKFNMGWVLQRSEAASSELGSYFLPITCAFSLNLVVILWMTKDEPHTGIQTFTGNW